MKFNVILLCSSLSQNKALIDQEYKDFLNELIRSGNELSDSGDPLFYIGSGGTEEQFKKIYQKYNEPYVLIATDHNNSLPAGLEILTFLNNLGLSGVIKHGNTKNIIQQINGSLNTKNDFHCHKPFIIDNLLLNKRYGVIGKPSDWLIASDVDYQVAKKNLGCDLIDISIEEVFERAKRYHIFLDKNSKVSLNSITILKVLQEILYEYKLDGFTIRCFDL